MRIDRCVCFWTTFAEMKALAAATGSTRVEDLQRHHPCGENCGLCVPYVRRMLRTGETVFSAILTDDTAAAVDAP